MGFYVCSMFCCALLCGLCSFAIILMEKRDFGCFSLFVFLVSCDLYLSVVLSHGVVDWYAVCDCSISRSYSLAFYKGL